MSRVQIGRRDRRWRHALAAGLLAPAVVLAAGAARQPEAPRPALPGKFVWHDLLTTDAPAVERFYGGLFGWTFEPQPGRQNPYKAVRLGGAPVGGIVDVSARKAEVPASTWLSYVSVPDVDAAAAEVRSRGGKVLREPAEVGTYGRAAVVVDPQGALFGLARIARGDPPDDPPAAVGTFLWMEYVAEDVPAALAFFGGALGWTSERVDGGAAHVEYHALKSGGKPRAGLYERPWKELRSNWLPYVRVADAAAAAKAAEALGGRVVLAPRPEVRKGTLAIVTDPSGAAVALQQWPIDGGAK